MSRIWAAILLAMWAPAGTAPVHQAPEWPTLAAAVAALGTDTAGLPPEQLDGRVTSYATLAADGEFGLAYYAFRGDRLEPPLYLAFRERGGTWRQAGLTDPADPSASFGSALAIHATPALVLIDTHGSPSSGSLLIVDRRTLRLTKILNGWLDTTVPNGRIVFTESMMHFAAAHPEELRTYDPRNGRQARLYPTNDHSAVRRAFVDRLRPLYAEAARQDPANVYGWDPESYDISVDRDSFRYVERSDALTFAVTFTGDRHPVSVGPPVREHVGVTCRPMASASPTCVETRR